MHAAAATPSKGGLWPGWPQASRDLERLGPDALLGQLQLAAASEPVLPPIDIIIPALNEAQSIGQVLGAIPHAWVRQVVVVDNGSEDATAEIARSLGACVIEEPRRGYGAACLAGLRALGAGEGGAPPWAVVFLDADFSDHPEELPLLVLPLLQGMDLVIGSRMRGQRQRGALLPQALFGNWLAGKLLWHLYGYEFTDLGPFRAITWAALETVGMEDDNFGWTVEMQVKAARHRLRCTEVPVRYRARIGTSKITGTLKGTLHASAKILYTLFRHAL